MDLRVPTYDSGTKGRDYHFLKSDWKRSEKTSPFLGCLRPKSGPNCLQMTQNNLWEVPEGSRTSLKQKKSKIVKQKNVQKFGIFEPKNWKNESVFPQKSMKFGLEKT